MRPTKIQFVAVDEAHVVCHWKILYVLLLNAAKDCVNNYENQSWKLCIVCLVCLHYLLIRGFRRLEDKFIHYIISWSKTWEEGRMWWCQFNLVHIFLWKLLYKPVSIYIVTAYLKKPLLYLANTMSVREIYRRSLLCWNFSLGNSPKAKSMQLSECGLPGSKNLDLCYQSAQSLLLQQQLLGIPATEAIFESLLFNNPCMVLESPNKENINFLIWYQMISHFQL